MPQDLSPSDTSLSPDFSPDDFGPPAGCVDALASWRRVIASLEQLTASLDRFDGALAQTQVDLGAALDQESAQHDG